MPRFCIVELPVHFDMPVSFTLLGSSEPTRRSRDFRYVQTGFMAAPHYHADLYGSPESQDPDLPLPAFRRISILNPERFDPDLPIRPALHPQRAQLTAWLDEASKAPKEPWVRHLPVFIRATIRDLSGPSSNIGAAILIPDHAVASITGDNGALQVSGFHDAAHLPIHVLDRNEVRVEPPLAPLELVGPASDPRRGFVTRAEAALADIALKEEEGAVGFDAKRFTQVMGRMLDRLASDEDRESGSYVFPLIVAEYIPHDDLFYFSAVTVSLCTEPASAYLRCVHHASAMLPADRLKPGFSDFVEDDLGQGSMHPDVWARLTEAARENRTPLIAFDQHGGLLAQDEPRTAGIQSETAFLIDRGTEVDLQRGLVKKTLFDLQGDQDGSPADHLPLSVEWIRRPISIPRGATEDLKKVAQETPESPAMNGADAAPAVLMQAVAENAASATENADAEQAATDGGDDDIDVDVSIDEAPVTQEPAGDDEDIPDEILTDGEEGEGDQGGGGSHGGAGSPLDLKPDHEPHVATAQHGKTSKSSNEAATERRLAEDEIPVSAVSAASVQRKKAHTDDEDQDEAVPRTTVLKQIELTDEHLRLLHEIASKTRHLDKKDIDALSQPNDRYMAILEAFWTLSTDPEAYLRGREDEIAPQEHTDVAYVGERWARNPVLRVLTLLRLDKQLPKDWNLDRRPLKPARMAMCLKSAERAYGEISKKLGLVAEGGGNGP